jgi:ubiquitin-conjugating enzyme E2 Z
MLLKKVPEWIFVKDLEGRHSIACHFPYTLGGSIFGGGNPHKESKGNDSEIGRMDIGRLIAPQATRRVLKDIERASEQLMRDQGIWYAMDETTMTKGHALIRGPEGTPYEGCLLVFAIEFQYDYPFSPPKVEFLTNDGKTRFHPNLYLNGKVCLSILGTYSGPSWSATQNLSSVLLSILALLDTNPLSHEPAYANGSLLDVRHRTYADFVEHQMIRYMLSAIQYFEKDEFPAWKPFQEILEEQLPSLKQALSKKILARQQHPETLWGSVMYNMGGRSYWKQMVRETPWIEGEAV